MMYAIARNDVAASAGSGGTRGGGNLLKATTTATATTTAPSSSSYGQTTKPQQQQRQQQEESTSTTTSTTTTGQEVITATVEKYYKEEKLGISITDDGYGSMIITKISSDSTFQFSDLEIGMKVISINGVNLVNYAKYNGPNASMKIAQSILKEAIGEVTIVAEKNTKTKTKKTKNQQVGVGSSRAAAAGTSSSSSSSSAATPAAVKNKNNIVVKVYKQYQDEKLGISVKRDSNTGKFFVSNISSTIKSPFAFTELKVDMRILSINGIDITGETLSFALLLLKDSIGEIVIVATTEVDEESSSSSSSGGGGGGKQQPAAANTGRQPQQRRPVPDDGLLPQQPSRPSARNNNNNNNNNPVFGDEFSIAAASFATRSNAPMEPYYVPRRGGEQQNYCYDNGQQRQIMAVNNGRLDGEGFQEEEDEEESESDINNAAGFLGSNPVVTTPGNIETFLYPTTTTKRPLENEHPHPPPTTTTTTIPTKTTTTVPAASTPNQAAVVPTTYVTHEIVNGHVIVVKRTVYPDGSRPEKIEKRIVEQARMTDDGVVQQQQKPTLLRPAAAHHQINTTTTTTANNNNDNGMVNYGNPDADTITSPVTFAATTTTTTTAATTNPHPTTTTMTNKITTTTKPQPAAAISSSTTPTTTTYQNSSSTTSKYLIVPAQQQWSVVGSTTVDGKPAYIGASMDSPPAINEIDNLFAIAISSQKYSNNSNNNNNNVSTSDINEYVFIFSSEEVEIDDCTILAGGGWYHITTKQAWSFLTRRSLAKSLKYSQTSLMHVVLLRVCSFVFVPGILIMIPIMIAHGRKSSKMRRFCKLSERRTTTMDGPSGKTQHKHYENRYSKFYQSDGSWKVPMKFIEKFRRN